MTTLQHKFVDLISEDIEDGILYISVKYCTAIHKCACGCGREVVTPISPTDWNLWFDGKSISLSPSIGNWNFECRSHYWIKNNKICYADDWSRSRINRERDVANMQKEKIYNIPSKEQNNLTPSFWRRFLNLFCRL